MSPAPATRSPATASPASSPRRSANVLLLSATPHSGKSDGFRRFSACSMMGFSAVLRSTRDRVQELVARTEKRTRDRQRRTAAVHAPHDDAWRSFRTAIGRSNAMLYDAVTEYVREGYGRAVREKRPAVGFLVLLMQRLVSSSTAAILAALEKRAAALDAAPEQLELAAIAWGLGRAHRRRAVRADRRAARPRLGQRARARFRICCSALDVPRRAVSTPRCVISSICFASSRRARATPM